MAPPLGEFWQTKAMALLGKTREEFRRMDRREQIRWLVYAEREYYNENREALPRG